MNISRRNALQSIAVGASALFGGDLEAVTNAVSSTTNGKIKRIVFFLQNQGFDPYTAIPRDLNENCSLDSFEFEEPIKPLEPIKDRLHIINGLHGKHTSPSHSAFFGALGGYAGGDGVPPRGETFDHVVSKHLPETILPHLCVGMDSLSNMKAKPTVANLSASGASKPIFMQSNPQNLYQMIYGGISEGDVRKKHEAQSEMLQRIEFLAKEGTDELPSVDAERYSLYTDGFGEINGLREKLASQSEHLKKFAPKYDEKFTNPEYETDWHDCIFDLGLSALKSGITNTLTIGSGRGEIFGSWKGLGVEQQGHNLGHMKQPDNDIWIKIRQYNCEMIAKMVSELEMIPEGNGNMMDNTLIVYTSNNADYQHTSGKNWPFILVGNPNGAFKTNQFTQLDGTRPINALYTTILHSMGMQADRFNMSNSLAKRFDSGLGPIESLLA